MMLTTPVYRTTRSTFADTACDDCHMRAYPAAVMSSHNFIMTVNIPWATSDHKPHESDWKHVPLHLSACNLTQPSLAETAKPCGFSDRACICMPRLGRSCCHVYKLTQYI